MKSRDGFILIEKRKHRARTFALQNISLAAEPEPLAPDHETMNVFGQQRYLTY